jgi:hypothetical protein
MQARLARALPRPGFVVYAAPMQPFAEATALWHDFYLLAGTVAATLMGLLFVAMSIHWDVIVEESRPHLHAIALEAFGSFLVVTFLALMMLAPAGAPRPFGLGVAMLGVVRFVIGIRHSKQIWGSQDEAFSKSELIYRSVMLPAAFVLLAGAGVLLMKHQIDMALAVLTFAVFLLIAMGARAAWDLLVRVGRIKVKLGQRIS